MNIVITEQENEIIKAALKYYSENIDAVPQNLKPSSLVELDNLRERLEKDDPRYLQVFVINDDPDGKPLEVGFVLKPVGWTAWEVNNRMMDLFDEFLGTEPDVDSQFTHFLRDKGWVVQDNSIEVVWAGAV